MLTITEEILLLLHDERRADFLPGLKVRSLDVVLAGSVLADLAFAGRIDTDLESLSLVDPAPLGDELLDPALAEIAADAGSGKGKGAKNRSRTVAWWIEKTTARGPETLRAALERLGELGIFESRSDEAVHLTSGVSRSRRYAGSDGEIVEDVRLRVMRALFSDDVPDPRDAVIIALAEASGAFRGMLSELERHQVQERIDLFRQLDMIGRSVAAALETAAGKHVPAAPPSKTIPEAPGLPLIGNGLAMFRDPNEFLLRQYRNLGPVFRIRAPGRNMVVIAGPEANLFMKKAGTFLRLKETWIDYNREVGAAQVIASIDGPEHQRMRRETGFGHTAKVMEGRIGTAVRVLREEFDRSRSGAVLSGLGTWRRIHVEQLAVMAVGRSVLDYLDDIGIFLDNLLKTHLARIQPRFILRLPGFRRAHRRMDELADLILAEHGSERGGDGLKNQVDVLIDLHRRDPQFMPETDIVEYVLSPFLAGNDTIANTVAAAFYHLLESRELRERVAAEAAALFAAGEPSVRDLSRMDVTQRVLMEAMRRYPVSLLTTPRTVANSFEFAGYRVAAGEEMACALNLCCLLPEYFPDPLQFDIERFAPGREEHRQRGVFSPFGMGAHACPGSSIVHALGALNLAVAACEVDAAFATRSGAAPKMKFERSSSMRPKYQFRFLRRLEAI